jgi:uncharacterized protein
VENGTHRPYAVITGASSGIGFALAQQFAANGFDILITAEDEKLAAAQTQLMTRGGSVDMVQINLSSIEGVEALYQAIKAQGRPVDAIALNAGVDVSGDFVRKTQWDEELNLIKVNIISTTYLAKLVLKDMVARNQGRVLFTSSIVSNMPAATQAVYGASKAYIQSLGVALRTELKDTDVTLTLLRPGATDTPIFAKAGADDTEIGQSEKDDPEDVARQGFEAMMRGDEQVTASSLKTKIIGVASYLLPESIKAELNLNQGQKKGD